MGKCQVCGADATKKCSICKTTYYCTVNHQKSDWIKHKKECKVLPEKTSSDSPHEPKINNLCYVCEAPATKRCSNCKSIFYCTQEHQHSDWARHKLDCVTTPKDLNISSSNESSNVTGSQLEMLSSLMEILGQEKKGLHHYLTHKFHLITKNLRMLAFQLDAINRQ